MPTKTDRILSYLPGTFRALPRPTALYAVVDTFGNELLLGENSLAEVMLAHWVDRADRGAEFVQDLACIAALYGLAPRGAAPPDQAPGAVSSCPPLPSDETVEEFREHLKRFVRTFLEGTVTVQGVLRVVAEALGLRIADAYTDMDTWWTRLHDELITVEPRGDDAATLLFGADTLSAVGEPSRPARIVGSPDLKAGVDLRGAAQLRLKINTAAPVDIDLAPYLPNLALAMLDELKTAINTTLGVDIASHDDRHLILTSPRVGSTSRLEVQDIPDDAAPRLFGLPPRVYWGAEATAGRATGSIDLSGGVDLSEVRYLRLLVDERHLAEIDCAGGSPGLKTLDEIKAAINTALGLDVAEHDGRFLTLTSPTTGAGSSITFQPAAAQDARDRLFGPLPAFHAGRASRPAEAIGRRDLSGGLDLSERSLVRIRLNNRRPVTVDCAGEDPARTRPAEIATALNEALGAGVAGHNGRFIRLTSPTVGPASRLSFEKPPAEDDATELIFGLGSKVFHAAAATPALLIGRPDLSEGADLAALHLFQIALDGDPAVVVDVEAGVADSRAAGLDEMVAAINTQLGVVVASHDGQHLILTSPTTGGASRIVVGPFETTRRRRFVSRALIMDEAAQAIFGFITRQAQGTPAAQARLVGTVDLSRGVDVREKRFLRISLDDQPARDIDAAARSPRPRAIDALTTLLGHPPGIWRGREAGGVNFVGLADLEAGVDLSVADRVKIGVDNEPPQEITCAGADPAHTTLNEIVMAINVALNAVVAHHDGKHVILTSPTTGPGSRLEFAPTTGPDATRTIFGLVPPRIYRGTAATKAQVIGAQTLPAELDLRVARFLRLALDGGQPVDVNCAAPDAAHTRPDQVVAAIEAALGPDVAGYENGRLVITSRNTGGTAQVELLPYTTGDARTDLLGEGPAIIQGSDPLPATMVGEVDLLTPVNLAERRILRLAVDGGRSVDVDVAGAAPATTFLDEIVARLNADFPGLASATDDDRLRLTSPTAGASSRLDLLPLRALELMEYLPQEVASSPQLVRHGDRWHVDNDGAAEADLEIELRTPHGAAGPSFINTTTGQRVRLMMVLRPGERVQVRRDPEAGLQAVLFAADGSRQPVPGMTILAGPLGSQAWVPFAEEWQLSGGAAENQATLLLNNPLAPAVLVLRAQQPGPVGNRIAVSVTWANPAAIPNGPVTAAGQPVRLVGRVRVEAAGTRLVADAEATLARLRAGPGVNLAAFDGAAVAVHGPLHPGEGGSPVMVVERIIALFDVTLSDPAGEGGPLVETYSGVTIGLGAAEPNDLARLVETRPSQLVRAAEADKAGALTLPRGRSDWIYLDCYGARFNYAHFNADQFAGGLCVERGVFNLSRFAQVPPELEAAVFAPAGPLTDPPVEVHFCWSRHQPGAFVVNLPADLPAQFGGRFNHARFGRAGDQPESYDRVVTEPTDDPDHLVTRLNAGSVLVKAAIVERVPLGFEAMTIPLRRPRLRTLAGGTENEPARLYLTEPDVPGFIEIQARQPGPWGNAIGLTVRKAAPALFDVTVSFQGGRFENARHIALGGPLPALKEELLQPGPVGVLQARAAGIRADVTRDRT